MLRQKLLSNRRLIEWIGKGMAIVGVFFVGYKLYDFRARLEFAQLSVLEWTGLACVAILYGASCILLAHAWRLILSSLGSNVQVAWSIRVYGVSQLAKYVPGNIFHLAGRQGMGMAAGIGALSLVKSIAWELGLLSLAAGLFFPLALPAIFPGFDRYLSVSYFIVSIILVWFSVLLCSGKLVSRAFLIYVVFLIISGLVFVACDALVRGRLSSEWSVLVGAYVVSWLAGLLTPGAPAGFGVRESVLISLLPNLESQPELLLIVLLGRLVTVVGDALFWVVANAARVDA